MGRWAALTVVVGTLAAGGVAAQMADTRTASFCSASRILIHLECKSRTGYAVSRRVGITQRKRYKEGQIVFALQQAEWGLVRPDG